MGLEVGSTLPEFSLPDQYGTLFHSKEYREKPMVIFFYPKDFTPGCIKEVCSFRDAYEVFSELGAEVVGISSDSEQRHQQFSRHYKVPFKLLADKNSKIRKLFKIDKNLFNLLPGRETLVVNREGKIIMVFNSTSAAKHVPMALKALKEETQL